MSEVHNTITETAPGGYARTYNWIAAIYYWPRMSRDIKRYISTCNICQKTKPRCHAPVGMLQPIPIPSQPFEVVLYKRFFHRSLLIKVVWVGDLVSSSRGERGESGLGAASIRRSIDELEFE